MKKGMSATELIVALAVGLIVIIGLGYLVWTWLGKGGGQVTESYCNAKLLSYCTRWSANGFDTNLRPDNKRFSETYPECNIYSLSDSKEACERMLNPTHTGTT